MFKKTKHVKTFLMVVMIAMLGATSFSMMSPALASADINCGPGYGPNEDETACEERNVFDSSQGTKVNCEDGKVPGNKEGEPNINGQVCIEKANSTIVDEPSFEGDCRPGKDSNGKTIAADSSNCGIVAYLVTAINILSGLVGVIVVIMIAIGGIQYSTSRDNPQAVQAAKKRIINAILALVAYLFMYGFLQWIVPGGLL